MFAFWTVDGAKHQFNKTDDWNINGHLSWKRRIQNISKNQNLYPHQSRITLFTLLWDTLYVLLYYTTLLETIIIDCNACYYGIYVVVCTGLKIWSGKVRNCTALIDLELGTYLYFVVWHFWWTKSADFLFCKTGNTNETHKNFKNGIFFWPQGTVPNMTPKVTSKFWS